MSTKPAISICVPAYKAERFLLETLESARAQTFTDWELLVTEDGSKDGTEAIVRDFAKTVTQDVRYLRHDPNAGLPATRNRGIEAARSDWIALLDSDDLWKPTHLADVYACAQATNAGLIHSGSLLFDSDTGRELELRAPSPDVEASFPLSLYEARYIIQPASVLLHRAAWEAAGRFDPSFRYVEDRDMWLRCARAGVRFAYTGKITCLYRKHAAALSTHSAAMAEADARVFQKHLDWAAIPEDLRRRRVYEAWLAAGSLSWRSTPRAACRQLGMALRIRRHPKALALWCAAFLKSLVTRT